MLEGIPITGYTLCYGPLAVIIIGFIIFAAMTDGIARRTYLRLLDPRPDEERFSDPAPVKTVDKPTTTITPSGATVTLQPTKTEAAAVEADPEQTAVVDDLKRIEGIGPKISSVLTAAGITTFAQLATTSVDELQATLDKAGLTGINNPETWPEQAKLAAAGEWEALEALQDELKGGRRA